jgi:superfamily II DNA or RNA helicase
MRKHFATVSAKFNQLLHVIREADSKDLAEHGKLFKHFIFTDIRSASYGAKAIASFLGVNGYDLIFETATKMRSVRQSDGTRKLVPAKTLKVKLKDLPAVDGGSNRVGILQSAPLWKSPMAVEVRKEMLRLYNSRPDNIHGEHIRFMILDSKYKEGIDLYDVKHVHIMEPPITEADLKQAIGRATRYCGQRGLHFVPNVGWKLNVHLYAVLFAKGYPFAGTDRHYSIEPIDNLFDAHRYLMGHSGIDLGMMELTRELTILSIRTAVDYDLTYKINNFNIQSEIHDLAELKDAAIVEVKSGGGAIQVYPKLENISLQKCMKRSNKMFPFTVTAIRQALLESGKSVPPRASRQWLCDHVTPDIVERMLETARSRLASRHEMTEIYHDEDDELRLVSRSTVGVVSPSRTVVDDHFPSPSMKRLSSKDLDEMPSLADFFAAHEARAAMYRSQFASFDEFQEYIRSLYAKYEWESPVVRNACEDMQAVGQSVQFSKSQDFVRHFLTPESPFKGLLAWHSVGTGKTCTAIATASTEFEKRGYTVLWVTKNSLMADVWKNMFDTVCSVPVQEHVATGKPIPETRTAQRRLISRLWHEPISYRMFQNALVPRRDGNTNELGRILRKRNGSADPLRKTFIIIDEVHKLLDGDLKPSEQADFNTIARHIKNSYAISGDQSARVLLMTATPITDSPDGLFRMLNMLIARPADELPALEDFRREYTMEDGKIKPEGVRIFQQRAKGLISYLNREYDRTAFAQPEFKTYLVPAIGSLLLEDEEIIAKCFDDEAVEDGSTCDLEELEKQHTVELEQLAGDDTLDRKAKAARRATLKASYRQRKDDCKQTLRAHKKRVKESIARVEQCATEASKLRKKIYTVSQQKRAGKCFGKEAHGKTQKFRGLVDLRRMVRLGRPSLSKQTKITDYT